MRNGLKATMVALLSGFLTMGALSCSQYEDNTSVTLVSKTERLSRTWKVAHYSVDNVEVTPLMAAYTETFTKEGAFSFQWVLLGGTASWAFQNGAAEIKITNVDNVASKTLTILRLEESALWYYYMDGAVRKEVQLIPQ